MKKLFLLLLLPLLGLGGGFLSAQTVSGLKVETASGSASTVTFDVEWVAASLTTPWLDSMWVFVDYNKNGKMERLLISGGTLTEHTAAKAGTGEFIYENDMGAWVYGDARTNTASSFSAKVQLYTKEPDIIIAGACAYASSYPPVGDWLSDSKLGFTGTPMYDITLTHTNGGTITVSSGGAFFLPCSYTVSSFTDRTGAPGILSCIPSTDIYDLTVSATTYCPGNAVTFALDNTTSGRTYQLYKDGVAVMDELLSTGGGATFIGTFAGAGNYAARVKENGTYCAAQMSGVHVVSESPVPDAPTMGDDGSQCGAVGITATAGANGGTGIRWWDGSVIPSRTVSVTGPYYAVTTSDEGCESIAASVSVVINPVPAAPTSPSTNSRCGAGTVTFRATAPSSCTIDWYTASSGGSTVTGGYGATSFSPIIYSSMTYHAQARNTTTGCVSATRLPVSGGMIALPGAPGISGSGTYCSAATITASIGSGGNGIRWENGATVTPRNITTSGTRTYSAVTTAATGCESSAAAITVTINQPGSSGNAPTTCGCAVGLTDCCDVCKSSCNINCAYWPDHCWSYGSSLTWVTSRVIEITSDDKWMLTWQEANSHCNSLGNGWRLPTNDELQCMCNHMDELPGGWVGQGEVTGLGAYWSGTSGYYAVSGQDCSVNGPGNSQGVSFARCVK
jgi:hypothetical protein